MASSAIRQRLVSKIKSRLESFLNDTCTISRIADSYGDTGAPTGTPVVVATGVSCRMIEGKSDTEDIGQQHSLTETYTVVLPLDTIIDVDYLVTLANGNVYRVMDIVDRHTESVDVQAMVKRERR